MHRDGWIKIQMTIISTTCSQEYHRRNGVALIINKVSEMYLGATSKITEWSRIISKATHSTYRVFQVYPPNTDGKVPEAVQFCEKLEDVLELTPKIYVQFITGYFYAKLGSQEITEITSKFGLWKLNETGQSLTEFYQTNALFIAKTPFQGHNWWLYTSDQFSHQLCPTLWPHESWHTRPPCLSPTPRVYPNPCP